ncbi:hypothetical protein FKM82_000105 [Ascaphus truei]
MSTGSTPETEEGSREPFLCVHIVPVGGDTGPLHQIRLSREGECKFYLFVLNMFNSSMNGRGMGQSSELRLESHDQCLHDNDRMEVSGWGVAYSN